MFMGNLEVPPCPNSGRPARDLGGYEIPAGMFPACTTFTHWHSLPRVEWENEKAPPDGSELPLAIS